MNNKFNAGEITYKIIKESISATQNEDVKKLKKELLNLFGSYSKIEEDIVNILIENNDSLEINFKDKDKFEDIHRLRIEQIEILSTIKSLSKVLNMLDESNNMIYDSIKKDCDEYLSSTKMEINNYSKHSAIDELSLYLANKYNSINKSIKSSDEIMDIDYIGEYNVVYNYRSIFKLSLIIEILEELIPVKNQETFDNLKSRVYILSRDEDLRYTILHKTFIEKLNGTYRGFLALYRSGSKTSRENADSLALKSTKEKFLDLLDKNKVKC